MYLAWSGRSSEAIAEAKRALTLDPTDEALNNVYANTLFGGRRQGRSDDARTSARGGDYEYTPPRLLRCGDRSGRGDVSSIARRIEAIPPNAWGSSGARTYLALGQGDTARALDYMEKAAARDGDLLLAQALNSSLFAPLRGNARFAKVLRRFNLDAATIGSAQVARPR